MLPLTSNYRSRPEVLAVVNHLFGAEFGEGFQPSPPRASSPTGVRHAGRAARDRQGGVLRVRCPLAPAEARHVARRVRELVDTGAATPGEIVLLFAAGTDAEWYEEELARPVWRPTARPGVGTSASSRSSTCSPYLRLLQNRYDDEALVSVLASPFVGVSNDALVLLRRNAARPIFTGLERRCLEDLDPARHTPV